MWEAFFSRVLQQIEMEWHVIRRVPLAFLLAVIFVGLVIWYGVSAHYLSHYEGTISELGATIQSSQATIQTSQERRDQLQDRVAQLQDELSRAQGEKGNVQTDETRAQIDALQRRLAPRRVVKREEFIRALREAGPATLHMNHIAGDRDAADLFEDLHYLLIAGGWEIKNTATVAGRLWEGVHVLVKDINAPPPGAALMVELLRQNGIAAGLVGHPTHVDLTSTVFLLDIGYKP